MKRIKDKLDNKKEEKDKLKEELGSDYVTSEEGSEGDDSCLSADEKQFLKVERSKNVLNKANSMDLNKDENIVNKELDGDIPDGAKSDREIDGKTNNEYNKHGRTASGLIQRIGLDGELLAASDNLVPIKNFEENSGFGGEFSMEKTNNNQRNLLTISPLDGLNTIKEKNPVFEEEVEKTDKANFNPVMILGKLLKELTKKRKNEDN